MTSVAHNERGVSVIEVLVSLSMAAIVIASVANLVAAIGRVTTTSGNREQALAYAKQALEVVNEIKDTEFACNCRAGGPDAPCTAPTVCTRAADGKSCTLTAGYTSCWTTEPAGLSGSTFAPSDGGGSWHLVPTANPDGDVIGSTPFSWKLTFTDLGANSNTKQAVASVHWTEHGNGKDLQLTTFLTAWKNL